MSRTRWLSTAALLALATSSGTAPTLESHSPETLASQREHLLDLLAHELRADEHSLQRVRSIFEHSAILGQGNPSISVHPISLEQCEAQRRERPLWPGDAHCGSPYMVALYDPSAQSQGDARVCIDQFEFPGVPCQYPVVHVRASEAAALCEAMGKRLCDAHEWEGACAGALLPASSEYAWGYDRAAMRARHNTSRQLTWAYGTQKNHALCATNSFKTPGCPGSGYAACGSNTLPTSAFPDCVSDFGVYDQHGNVAEHMSLPMSALELGSADGHGSTEMKGSWFIFGEQDAHPDDCRWRAPNWHGSRVTDPNSHSNYHLGFRCCKDL
ncbi:MAG TPA: SUMF1/EgtB/PvdO family nonheme iron enzyme [Polyangiaceae bacterium]|nr:SUMF1/EgtB/PvdO family nonheme iron enzyme [Polyangiaceae bacterium]